MLIVGLTGGIGSGKSAVTEIFSRLGTSVIDTDLIAHQLTALGQPALATIREQFGDAYFLPDGNLDRANLRRLIFSDSVARKRLEALLHPVIQSEVNHRLAAVQAPYAIVAVPLLLETGTYRKMVQRIVVVDCDEAQQVERVMARSRLSEEEVRAIISSQIKRAERLRLADDIIDNHGDRSGLLEQVERLHHLYLQQH